MLQRKGSNSRDQIHRQRLPSTNAYERKQLPVPRRLTHNNFHFYSTLSPQHLDLSSIKKRDLRELEAMAREIL